LFQGVIQMANEDIKFETEILQRIARLESKVEDQSGDIKEIKEKLNGYLERRIKTTIKAFLTVKKLMNLTSALHNEFVAQYNVNDFPLLVDVFAMISTESSWNPNGEFYLR